ncbi:hypothetical protein FH972_024682 [Carpinus fangiana]|uniref:CENP-V/GFA domain-containing protein n=1 Tax=Carpinus fangiana TaxID=176857 RepID=A0A5N6KZ36_9ROSI|nr:hypothetical protein FH972_024682 [Carpinus fangiana]
MSGYDRALSGKMPPSCVEGLHETDIQPVFSPDGHVFQVEYALEAVKRGQLRIIMLCAKCSQSPGTCAVGVKGKDIVVLGCEKRSAMKLQDTRITPSKISLIDEHVCLAFAGLNADARILVDKARMEAQSHRLTVEDPVSIEYITKYIAGVQQRYTQSGGVRPFGISTLVIGFDPHDKIPRLYQTEPSGIYSAWKANAIGRSSKTVREFLERNHKDDMDREETLKLTIKSLLEVVQTGAKNIEIAIVAPGKKLEMLPVEDIEKYVESINTEKQEEADKKKAGRGGAGSSTATIPTRPAGEGVTEPSGANVTDIHDFCLAVFVQTPRGISSCIRNRRARLHAVNYEMLLCHPSLFGASLTSKIVLNSSCFTRSSLPEIILSAMGPFPAYLRVFELLAILPEALLALFTGKCHVQALLQRVGLLFRVAFGTVEPFAAAWRADSNLCIEDVFTVSGPGQRRHSCLVTLAGQGDKNSGRKIDCKLESRSYLAAMADDVKNTDEASIVLSSPVLNPPGKPPKRMPTPERPLPNAPHVTASILSTDRSPPSESSSSISHTDIISSKKLPPPAPHPRRPQCGTPPQRPLSMLAAPPVQTIPRVDVTSPTSPPRTLPAKKIPPQPPAARRSPSPRASEQTAPPAPPPTHARHRSAADLSSDGKLALGLKDMSSLSVKFANLVTMDPPKFKQAPPPPVKRASKLSASLQPTSSGSSKASSSNASAPESSNSPFQAAGYDLPAKRATPSIYHNDEPRLSKPTQKHVSNDSRQIHASDLFPESTLSSSIQVSPRLPSQLTSSNRSSPMSDLPIAPIRAKSGGAAEEKPVLPPRKDLRAGDRTIASPVEQPVLNASPAFGSSALNMGFSNAIDPSLALSVTTVASASVTPSPRNRSPVRSAVTFNIDGPNRVLQEPAKASTIDRGTSNNPDSSRINRSIPFCSDSPRAIPMGYEARLVDVCGNLVCAAGLVVRVWDSVNGRLLLSMPLGEQVKATAVAFKPSRKISNEGTKLWVGTDWGELLEIDIQSKRVTNTNATAHPRREVLRILRHGADLWTFDDEGKLWVWPADEVGEEGWPDLDKGVQNARITRRPSAAMVTGHTLWVANGKEIRVYEPTSRPQEPATLHTQYPLTQASAGDITCATALSRGDHAYAYFGHGDGKVSVYQGEAPFDCIAVLSISSSRLYSILGVGSLLWAAFGSGTVLVIDPTNTIWTVKKEWRAHSGPVVRMVTDSHGTWKTNNLQVISLGTDNDLCIWDGLLRNDWLDDYMHTNQAHFCTYQAVSALVLSWNAGASKPSDLKYKQKDDNFFRELLHSSPSPDIIVFGLQELVDLEDKKLTAKAFLKGRQKDAYGQEHIGATYRAWRDYLTWCLDDSMPPSDSYTLLHTASLVGLFTCVFVKGRLRNRIRNLSAAEVKTGMGGLHGNKGALVIRFLLDDSSLCLINCHLAAGQTQTSHRNNDLMAILESEPFPVLRLSVSQSEVLNSGGDGSMVLDHEICLLNGDLNYRIDTIPRESVISAVRSKNYRKLLERDQLLLQHRKNPGFRLRPFRESPIEFAPTYKYDVGSDDYDTGEKRRVPAWCDRILWRGEGLVQQLTYERHEMRVSDHRPVSGRFNLRIKSVDNSARAGVQQTGVEEYESWRTRLSHGSNRLARKFGRNQSRQAHIRPLNTYYPPLSSHITAFSYFTSRKAMPDRKASAGAPHMTLREHSDKTQSHENGVSRADAHPGTEGKHEWKQRPPYSIHKDNFNVKLEASCHCGQVKYQLSRETPLDSKLCHCTTCQKQHAAPFQWAAIFHKTDINFVNGHDNLEWYDPTDKSIEHKVPCKVRCHFCHSPIMDEGRNMILLFPSLIDFKSKDALERFKPKLHMFYGQRVVDIPDGLPKWSGLNNDSDLIEDSPPELIRKRAQEEKKGSNKKAKIGVGKFTVPRLSIVTSSSTSCQVMEAAFAAKPRVLLGLCHCLTCRKLTGSTYSTCLLLPETSLALNSNSPVKSFETKHENGMRIKIFFCGECGTSIYKQADADAFRGLSIVMAGTLDGDSNIETAEPQAEFWVKYRPHWVAQASGGSVKQIHAFDNPPAGCKLDLKPFQAEASQQQLDNFKQLVRLAPLGPQTYENAQEDQRYGISWKWMSEAKKLWETSYDWRACESRINAFPNFTATVTDPANTAEEHTIHFVALFSSSPNAIPLTFLHGWPGSILEFLPILHLLKEKYPSPSKLPYHIIVPSLPGYGYSSGPPQHRDFDTEDTARLINALMEGLGFKDGYVTQGGDIGSIVSRELAGRHEACKAMHVNFLVVEPPKDVADADVTAEEQEGLKRFKGFMTEGNAYAREHGTRPSTIGFVLSSSPVALLAWIAEKFIAWSDVSPSQTDILDSVTLYWLTQSFPRAIYPYRGSVRQPRDYFSKDSVFHIGDKPMGFSWFPMELAPIPVAWVKKTGNLVWYKRHADGGHFAAMEKPRELLEDVEEFVGQAWPQVTGSKL